MVEPESQSNGVRVCSAFGGEMPRPETRSSLQGPVRAWQGLESELSESMAEPDTVYWEDCGLEPETGD